MITNRKRREIKEELSAIEAEENVTILWACESGSRAWGFESRDSDYDVRFIYLRSTKDYLRASSIRDVIEKPISDDLDISGWDLQKALGLFRKSNPPLYEWLQSPIVYRRNKEFIEKLRELMPYYFSPVGCMYHYMNMSKRDKKYCLGDTEFKYKKYFYMLRPVLACIWIEQGLGVPPIEFQKMVDKLLPSGELKDEIEKLKERKRKATEVDFGPQIRIISDFIVSQSEKFTEVTKETQFTKSWEPLDELFRDMILLVNGDTIEPVAGGDATRWRE